MPRKPTTESRLREYEHVCRCEIPDRDALAVETNLFRLMYNTVRPCQALARP